MLTEKEVRILYQTAREVVERAMTQVTIDVHVVEAEQHCKILAAILEEPFLSGETGQGSVTPHPLLHPMDQLFLIDSRISL